MKQHLAELIHEGRASAVQVALATAFGDFLQGLAWAGGSTLDWSAERSTTINLSRVTDDDVIAWARSTRAGRHTHLMFPFPDDPPLLCAFEYGITHFDLLTGGRRDHSGSVASI